MTRVLMEGSHAIAEAAIQAGCRFYAGYPITPSTEILEYMSHRLPQVGGVCMNAESELEAINMVWGAAGCGVRAMIASTGQGISLMQESFAELANAEIPCVIVNMMRGQGDYFQATRGGGHGDYRHLVLAPIDVREGVELTRTAFDLAAAWRNPVLVFGDYYLAHTAQSVAIDAPAMDEPTAPDWALDGTSGGTGHAKLISPLGAAKRRDRIGYDLAAHYRDCAAATAAMLEGVAPMAETIGTDDAEVVVVAFGTPAKYVRAAVRELRAEG